MSKHECFTVVNENGSYCEICEAEGEYGRRQTMSQPEHKVSGSYTSTSLIEEIADLRAKMRAIEEENIRLREALELTRNFVRGLDVWHAVVIPKGTKLDVNTDFKGMNSLGEVVDKALEDGRLK